MLVFFYVKHVSQPHPSNQGHMTCSYLTLIPHMHAPGLLQDTSVNVSPHECQVSCPASLVCLPFKFLIGSGLRELSVMGADHDSERAFRQVCHQQDIWVMLKPDNHAYIIQTVGVFLVESDSGGLSMHIFAGQAMQTGTHSRLGTCRYQQTLKCLH